MDVTFIVAIFLFILFVTVILVLAINYFVLLPQSTTTIELRDKTKSVFDIFFGNGGIVTNERSSVDLYRVPVVLTETAGTARTNQPIGVSISYDDTCGNKAWNNSVRVYDQQFNEMPSKIGYQVLCSNQYINSSTVVFLANVSANEKKIFYVYSINNTNTTPPRFNLTLAGYWTFDEGSGTLAKDFSGNVNNGTLSNGAVWASSIAGNSIQFDGLDDYVNASNSNSLDISGTGLTLAAWVKINNTAGTGTTERIISKTSGDGSEQYELLYTSDSHGVPNKFRLDVKTSNGLVSVYTATTYTSGTWIHVAGRYNNSYIAIFINGTEVNGASQSGSISSTSSEVDIGRLATGGQLFNGTIDEVRIYNTNISTSEIQSIGSLPPTVNILPDENITAISADKFNTLAGRNYEDVRSVIGDGWNYRIEIRKS
ncbi:MAG: LamG domain-containing protein [Candidatus Aenigmarchaeota archaeon]|nr:LamG domain-containing protein [Candidatus Aenigmarchaeota archaeon]